jgi:hypothetical protein
MALLTLSSLKALVQLVAHKRAKLNQLDDISGMSPVVSTLDMERQSTRTNLGSYHQCFSARAWSGITCVGSNLLSYVTLVRSILEDNGINAYPKVQLREQIIS